MPIFPFRSQPYRTSFMASTKMDRAQEDKLLQIYTQGIYDFLETLSLSLKGFFFLFLFLYMYFIYIYIYEFSWQQSKHYLREFSSFFSFFFLRLFFFKNFLFCFYKIKLDFIFTLYLFIFIYLFFVLFMIIFACTEINWFSWYLVF